MKYDEVLENARKVMAPNCRVCKNCNGRVCRGEVPGTGGRDSGEAFVQNWDYLWKIKILTDFIHEKREVDTRTRLFGQALEAPVFAAPVGGMGVSYNGYLSEEAYARALLNGCREIKRPWSSSFVNSDWKEEITSAGVTTLSSTSENTLFLTESRIFSR